MTRPSHERRVLFLALAGGFPALVTALVLLCLRARTPAAPGNSPDSSDGAYWIAGALLILLWLGFAFAVRERVVRPLQTIANLLSALGEGDFSIRARGARRGDALGEALLEVNALSRTLRDQRLGAVETTALLRTVMGEINLAVFAFDAQQQLCLVNPAGERLLGLPAERALGRHAQDLGLALCLQGNPANCFDASFPGAMGRWEMRRGGFRQNGLPHQLVVLADLSKALREEERLAWQRLLRVLGHELNNSLAPIKSLSGSLANLVTRDPLPDDWRDDLRSGLQVIHSRSEALSRFMADYSRLARLPPPRLQPVEFAPLIRRVASLETRTPIEWTPSPEIVVQADADQLEQCLINVLRNAVEASLETHGSVRIAWQHLGQFLDLRIEDDGLGIANPTNLFVPFFTTKPGGSGIGLALSRQIAEAHDGSLSLRNRTGATGCIATLRLPLTPPPA